ncbi:helix-turn-helix domain-containing protein [Actinoplanes sp. NPDC051851]|uniref:helix-turn-helix domain-containing protein n=1 Tax=Actinoplanes sp. NPDC051851 TaxID=3154753 RepID=UPI003441B810
MTTVFETSDAGAAEQRLMDTYTRFRMSILGHEHYMRLVQTPLGEYVALQHSTFAMSFDARGGPLGYLPVARVLAGTSAFHNRGQPTDLRPGDVFLACQPDRDWRIEVDGFQAEGARIDPLLFLRVAGTLPRFSGYRPVSAEAARRWDTTFTYARDVLRDTAAPAEPLLADSLAQLIAATTLCTFPNDTPHSPTIEDRRDAHPASLRRAIAFIDQNVHRDIGPADIASAAHVTIRSLQLTFRRHLDSSPMAYLRRARLDHVHRELRSSNPATATVGAVAARWGFVNHSRFTAHYHATYGTTPSRTLRDD